MAVTTALRRIGAGVVVVALVAAAAIVVVISLRHHSAPRAVVPGERRTARPTPSTSIRPRTRRRSRPSANASGCPITRSRSRSRPRCRSRGCATFPTAIATRSDCSSSGRRRVGAPRTEILTPSYAAAAFFRALDARRRLGRRCRSPKPRRRCNAAARPTAYAQWESEARGARDRVDRRDRRPGSRAASRSRVRTDPAPEVVRTLGNELGVSSLDASFTVATGLDGRELAGRPRRSSSGSRRSRSTVRSGARRPDAGGRRPRRRPRPLRPAAAVDVTPTDAASAQVGASWSWGAEELRLPDRRMIFVEPARRRLVRAVDELVGVREVDRRHGERAQRRQHVQLDARLVAFDVDDELFVQQQARARAAPSRADCSAARSSAHA